MIIVLHCSYTNNFDDINIDDLTNSLVFIFSKHQKFLDLFSHIKLIDIMNWRASQPTNNLVPLELQWSSRNKIGFCGDWFQSNFCDGVEGAMNSSIRLSKLID